MRVGLYLELLTVLGVIEAVRDEVGDLLTPREREAFEHADAFREIRRRVNVGRLARGVGAARDRVSGLGTPRAGPVSARNLLAKRRATLEFLHVHHEDLQARDRARRARTPTTRRRPGTACSATPSAPCCARRRTRSRSSAHLPAEVRRFVLWHRQRAPRPAAHAARARRRSPRLLGDQDGLFASACNQYRASMNHVADWARERALMDHTGDECVPRQVSLLEAHMNQPSRVALLQRRDGYDSDTLEVGADLPEGYEPPLAAVEQLLAGASIFSHPATRPRSAPLARRARPLTFGPMERIIVQGQEGDSLFVVVEGDVEVVLRREDGERRRRRTRCAEAP